MRNEEGNAAIINKAITQLHMIASKYDQAITLLLIVNSKMKI